MPNDYTLYDYQSEGVDWLKSIRDNGFGFKAPAYVGLIGDEMGLGKTAQALVVIRDLITKGKRGIIIVPGATVIQWQKNYERWVLDCEADEFGSDSLVAIRNSKTNIPRGTSIVISHAMLAKKEVITKLMALNFDFMVIDEIHKFGSEGTKRIKHLWALINLTPSKFESGRIALSGTPVRNYAKEIYNVAHFLDPEKFRTLENFSNKYLTFDRKSLWNPRQFHDDFAPYYIRRTVAQVQKSLPEIRRTKLYTEITDPLAISAYNKQLDLMSNFMNNSHKVDAFSLLGYLQKLRWITGVAKAKEIAILEPIKEYLETPREEGGGSVVIGLHHHVVRDRLVRSFGNKFKFLDLRGGMTDREKEAAKQEYIELSKTQNVIMYLSIKAAAEGVDGLQYASNKMYTFERSWNGADEVQLEKRLHRNGQLRCVDSEITMAIGTVDEFYDEMVEMKRRITTQVEDANYESNPAFLTQLAEKVIASPLRAPRKQDIEDIENELDGNETSWIREMGITNPREEEIA